MVETINNLWVLIAALLVFTMTISVGFLEVGELGEELDFSLLKTILMTGTSSAPRARSSSVSAAARCSWPPSACCLASPGSPTPPGY